MEVVMRSKWLLALILGLLSVLPSFGQDTAPAAGDPCYFAGTPVSTPDPYPTPVSDQVLFVEKVRELKNLKTQILTLSRKADLSDAEKEQLTVLETEYAARQASLGGAPVAAQPEVKADEPTKSEMKKECPGKGHGKKFGKHCRGKRCKHYRKSHKGCTCDCHQANPKASCCKCEKCRCEKCCAPKAACKGDCKGKKECASQCADKKAECKKGKDCCKALKGDCKGKKECCGICKGDKKACTCTSKEECAAKCQAKKAACKEMKDCCKDQKNCCPDKKPCGDAPAKTERAPCNSK